MTPLPVVVAAILCARARTPVVGIKPALWSQRHSRECTGPPNNAMQLTRDGWRRVEAPSPVLGGLWRGERDDD